MAATTTHPTEVFPHGLRCAPRSRQVAPAAPSHAALPPMTLLVRCLHLFLVRAGRRRATRMPCLLHLPLACIPMAATRVDRARVTHPFEYRCPPSDASPASSEVVNSCMQPALTPGPLMNPPIKSGPTSTLG